MSNKDKPKNSSMTRNESEMEEHGKVMEQMDTNQEVKEEGASPDPKQHKKSEED